MTTATTDLCYMSASDLLAAYRARTLSPVEVAEAVLDRIDALNLKLNAYLHVDREFALRAARAAEAAYAAENAGPLAGVPVSIKDLLHVRGMPTTFGSLVFRDFRPEVDSWSVAKLRAAGAVFPGKTNTPEFGSLATNENLLGDSARNPWNLDRTPGGSSGGAAAAVAAGLGPIAMGTDFGGSIRIPAACCGVFGFKPTLGRIARDTSWNTTGEFFSHEGPLARTVTDAALLLDVCAGPDPRDRFSQLGAPPRFAQNLERLPRSLRVAWSPDLGFIQTAAEYVEVCERAVRRFEDVVDAIDLALPEGAQEGVAGWLVAGRAGNYNHEVAKRKREQLELLTPIEQRTLEAVDRTTLPEIAEATLKVRDWRERAAAFHERYDLLLTPALAVPPLPIMTVEEHYRAVREAKSPWESRFVLTAFTAPFNSSGQPAAVVPCGFLSDGLPVALQIVGAFGADMLVMQAARAFEQALPWAHARPALA
jgi:aspartyl-tRNA(Asn)/glutamyl-tRNA(Gln) amidotransferase subunit A